MRTNGRAVETNGRILVSDEDLARVNELHIEAQRRRLALADAAVEVFKALGPKLLDVGEANGRLRDLVVELAKRYGVPEVGQDGEQDGGQGVFELVPSEGGFVRRVEGLPKKKGER